MVASKVLDFSYVILNNHDVKAFHNPEKQLPIIEWLSICTKEECKLLFDELLENTWKNPTKQFNTDIRMRDL